MLYPKVSGARSRACMVALSLVLGLAACRNEAEFAAINAEKAKPVHRYDHFQAVARHGDVLLAVGAHGAVNISKDAGANWSRTELPGAPGLVKAASCADGSLLALEVDGKLWRAEDAGRPWSANAIPATDAVLDMTCAANNQIWVVGARGAIFVSADGGKTWADRSLAEDAQLLNVQFPNAATGIITGEFGRVMMTRDGGAHWAETAGALGADFYPQGMHFADDQRGVVVGLSGAVLETNDGGKTWKRGKAPTEAPLYGVLAAPNGDLVVVGAAGTAFRRTNGTWAPIKGIPLTDLRALAAAPGGLVIGGAGILMAMPTQTVISGAN